MGIVRTTFVIDAGGKIRKVFPNVRVKGHSEAVLSTVRELQGPRRK
jgi:peroxiredoxin Q/BCP